MSNAPLKKTLFHSELVKAGRTAVRIVSDVMESQYPGKPPYVTMNISGMDRHYSCENDACAAVLQGQKGRTLVIEATGSRDDARIALLNQGQQDQPAPLAHEPHRPQPAQQPAPQQPQHSPVDVQRVGMCVKEACAAASGVGVEPNTPQYNQFVYEVASDLIRVCDILATGKLAPSAKDRAKPAAKTETD